jgi:hypothetical protein
VNRGKLVLAALGALAALAVPAWAALIERTDTVAVVNSASATAECPAGKSLVLGGFRTDRTNPAQNPPAPVKMQRVAGNDWRVSAKNWQGTPGATLTSIAYCRATRSLSVRKETRTLDVNEQGGVTAQCPRGQRVAFGGFAGVYVFDQAQMFIDRLTRPSGRSWRVAAVNSGDAPGDLTAIAYCGDVPRTEAKERTISVGPSDQKSVTVRCPRNHPLVFGGFETETTVFAAFVLIDGFERTGARQWQVSAQGGGGLAPGDLTAIAYCRA